jgi:hypothetical protein
LTPSEPALVCDGQWAIRRVKKPSNGQMSIMKVRAQHHHHTIVLVCVCACVCEGGA